MAQGKGESRKSNSALDYLRQMSDVFKHVHGEAENAKTI